jgi:hypothetical protein
MVLDGIEVSPMQLAHTRFLAKQGGAALRSQSLGSAPIPIGHLILREAARFRYVFSRFFALARLLNDWIVIHQDPRAKGFEEVTRPNARRIASKLIKFDSRGALMSAKLFSELTMPRLKELARFGLVLETMEILA